MIHPESNQQFDLAATVQFKANDHIGSIDFPYVLTMDESLCKTIKFSDAVYNQRYEVYPQVFQDLIHIEYTTLEADANANIRITDVFGHEIMQSRQILVKGFNDIQLDLKQIQIPGSYFISLMTNQKQLTKLIQKIN